MAGFPDMGYPYPGIPYLDKPYSDRPHKVDPFGEMEHRVDDIFSEVKKVLFSDKKPLLYHFDTLSDKSPVSPF